MSDESWFKTYRRMKRHPVIMKDGDHLAVWAWILMNVVYRPEEVDFNGKKITLQPGQFTTGRKEISRLLKINESKIQRILKCFENEHQIEQQTNSKCRLITVLKWSVYQKSEQPNERQVNTNIEYKNTNRKKKTDTTVLAEAIASADIVSIFDVFTPLGIQSYGNKTHRKCIEELVKAYGLEKVTAAAKFAVSIQNEKYAPVITNPYQLKTKFGELVAFKGRQDKNENKSLVAEI